MHISDIFQSRHPIFSFEFFPPKSAEAWEKLYETILDLEEFAPSFVSVTYGAGGSTRELTHDLVLRIKKTTSIPPVPHLTCVNHSAAEVYAILQKYAQQGVNNLLALRGDAPLSSGTSYDWSKGKFRHAIDLVRFVKKFNAEGHHPDPRGFGIGVAGFPEGHPDTPNRLKEMDYLKEKVDAGADYICTQLFFDNRDFFDFRDRCRLAGISVPILAGIMPVTSAQGMVRMAELSGGTRFPAKLLKLLSSGSSKEIEHAGIRYAAQQCAELLNEGVDGIHFYTLNKSHATREIYKFLGVF